MGERGYKQSGRDLYSANHNKILEYRSNWIGTGSDKIFSGKLDSHPTNQPINKKISYYDENEYYITDNVGDNKIINQEIDFTYKINKHGFRSQHFKQIDANKTTILTAGCSHSFGEGLPDELRWQSFLLKNINKNNLEHFDVSSMGASYRLIIRNIVSFIRNYGKPDYIFVVFPDTARDFMYNEELQKFQSVCVNTDLLVEQHFRKIPNSFINYTLSFNEYDSVMKSIESLWYLEELCKWAGIKLAWTSWVYGCSQIFKNCNFNNFIEQDWERYGKLHSIPNVENLDYWHLANDGAHMGASWTSWQGKTFSNVVLND